MLRLWQKFERSKKANGFEGETLGQSAHRGFSLLEMIYVDVILPNGVWWLCTNVTSWCRDLAASGKLLMPFSLTNNVLDFIGQDPTVAFPIQKPAD